MARSTATDGVDGVPAPSATTAGPRVLFDVGHPAQVHLFRNALGALEDRGCETFVTSREKEVTTDLLDAYGIGHVPLSTRGDSMPGLVRELLTREVRLFAVARRFRPDVIVSRLGPVPAHASALTRCRNVAVSDTHIDRPVLRRLYQGVTFPFVDTVCAPRSFRLPVADEKRRDLDFQELAYLHPKYFDPDPDVVASYGIAPHDPFFVVRVAGWDAYHDVGHAGISPTTLRRLISMLSGHGRVFVSAENELPSDLAEHELHIRPDDIHHVLAHADLYVGDSGTMSSEAAMLGTPAIRTNTMVGDEDENVFRELEERYGLLRSYADEARAFRAVEQMLAYGLDRVDWDGRRDQLLAEQPDVTERIVETVLESTPNDDPSDR